MAFKYLFQYLADFTKKNPKKSFSIVILFYFLPVYFFREYLIHDDWYAGLIKEGHFWAHPQANFLVEIGRTVQYVIVRLLEIPIVTFGTIGGNISRLLGIGIFILFSFILINVLQRNQNYFGSRTSSSNLEHYTLCILIAFTTFTHVLINYIANTSILVAYTISISCFLILHSSLSKKKNIDLIRKSILITLVLFLVTKIYPFAMLVALAPLAQIILIIQFNKIKEQFLDLFIWLLPLFCGLFLVSVIFLLDVGGILKHEHNDFIFRGNFSHIAESIELSFNPFFLPIINKSMSFSLALLSLIGIFLLEIDRNKNHKKINQITLSLKSVFIKSLLLLLLFLAIISMQFLARPDFYHRAYFGSGLIVLICLNISFIRILTKKFYLLGLLLFLPISAINLNNYHIKNIEADYQELRTKISSYLINDGINLLIFHNLDQASWNIQNGLIEKYGRVTDEMYSRIGRHPSDMDATIQLILRDLSKQSDHEQWFNTFEEAKESFNNFPTAKENLNTNPSKIILLYFPKQLKEFQIEMIQERINFNYAVVEDFAQNSMVKLEKK